MVSWLFENMDFFTRIILTRIILGTRMILTRRKGERIRRRRE